MFLENISLFNFKNIAQAQLQLSAKLNCFLGNNGMGKTNLLDAIWYLSNCKSYFSSTDLHVLQHNTEVMMLQGDYIRNQNPEKIVCGIKAKQKKQFKRNGKDYQRFSEHIGFLPAVMVSPSDGRLINDGSDERRKYINAVISQSDTIYLSNLIKYNHALQERNIMLKQIAERKRIDETLLEVLSDQMVHYGRLIFERRKQFLDQIIPTFSDYYGYITSEKEVVGLQYVSQLIDADFDQLMTDALPRDKATGFSTVGIHKDDIVFKIGDNSLKIYGSQGQKKSYLVALKLAEYEYISKLCGFYPILLLDDIFDMLDATRVERIVSLVSDNRFGQIFITDTNREHLLDILQKIGGEHYIFMVDSGNVSKLDNLI